MDKHVEKMAVNRIVKIHKLPMSLTIKEFWHRVAMLGGFLRRKSDGNPMEIRAGRLFGMDGLGCKICFGEQRLLPALKNMKYLLNTCR